MKNLLNITVVLVVCCAYAKAWSVVDDLTATYDGVSKLEAAAYYTCLAYDSKKNIKCLNKWLSKIPAYSITYITGSERFTVSEKIPSGHYVFAFRGDTTSNDEKIKNALEIASGNLRNMTFPNMKSIPVYEYALDKYEYFRHFVRPAIRKFYRNDPSAKFIFAGHSMGGPRAIFAGLDAEDIGIPFNRMEFIIFNSLRAGGKDLDFHIRRNGFKIRQIVEEKDPLIMFPFASYFVDLPGFIQVRNEKMLDCSKRYCRLAGPVEQQNLIATVLSNYFQNKELMPDIKEHFQYFGIQYYFSH